VVADDVSIQLLAVAESAHAARQAVDSLPLHQHDEAAFNVRLLVTELVGNSIRHAGLSSADSIVLRLRLSDDLLRAEVTDRGPGFQRPSSDDAAGHGLQLVDALADRWGAHPTPDKDGWLVWFEIDLRGSEPSAPTGTAPARVTQIQTERVTEQAIIVVPSGELDVALAPELYEAIQDAFAVVASVVVDLSEVDFIDSSIVAVITMASGDVARREAGTQLVIVSPPGSRPRRVLDLVRAEGFVRLCDDRTVALDSIGW
jgi:anti-anti-sigma factor